MALSVVEGARQKSHCDGPAQDEQAGDQTVETIPFRVHHFELLAFHLNLEPSTCSSGYGFDKTVKVCFVASEIFPFSKVGGLADVVGALSRMLAANGIEVRVFTPLYPTVDPSSLTALDSGQGLPLPLGSSNASISLWHLGDPGSGVQRYFADSPRFFLNHPIYTEDSDEPLRFAALCHAALLGCESMGWAPDLIHCHDWQASLIPLYLKTIYSRNEFFKRTKTLMTIHNLGYQGIFSSDCARLILPSEFHSHLDREDLNQGRVNLLKTGILHADWLTTVSPTYSREIQTAEYGAGLDHLLRERSSSLTGILNGVDYDNWSPELDPHITENYSRQAPIRGKQANQEELLGELGLPYDPEIATAGVISRLVWQKGFELLEESLPQYLQDGRLQLVVLGSGESRYETLFANLARDFPRAACFVNRYDPALAHRVEAGCDLFLMPSRYEPCGLNQMYSLKYGTVPVVRRTGGLADTVSHFDPASREGTGFVFEHFAADGFRWALDRALDVFGNRKAWRRLVQNGMSQDFSWQRRVGEYLKLYRDLTEPGA